MNIFSLNRVLLHFHPEVRCGRSTEEQHPHSVALRVMLLQEHRKGNGAFSLDVEQVPVSQNKTNTAVGVPERRIGLRLVGGYLPPLIR